MNLKMEIKGVSDMTRKLQARINRLERSIMVPALMAFAEPIRAEGERLARALISPRIQFTATVRRTGSQWRVKVGPSTATFRVVGGSGKSAGWTITSAMICYFFEFGYDIRHKRKGPVLAHVGARPTLTPAFLAKQDEGLAAMEQVLRDALEQDVAA